MDLTRGMVCRHARAIHHYCGYDSDSANALADTLSKARGFREKHAQHRPGEAHYGFLVYILDLHAECNLLQ
jgi:hypothetical protein